MSGFSNIPKPVSIANGGTGDTGTSWSQTTPVPAAVGGAFTTASAIVRSKTEGKKTYIWAQITITSLGTGVSGFTVAIPTATLNTSPVSGVDNNIAASFVAYVSGSTLTASLTPAAHVYYMNGIYEAA